MPRTTRSDNLDLIRHLNGGHINAVKKLSNITNENYISNMANGNMEVSDYNARRIEKELALPDGWMDRDNRAMLSMSKVDFGIYSCLSGQPQAAKDGLLNFLISTANK